MRRPKTPDPELVVCAWRGHETPGAHVAQPDVRHHVLVRPTADGRRFVQCLRCGCWLLVDEPAHTTAIDDLNALERPRRGRALRDAIVMRLIAFDRAAHAVAFGAVAIAAGALDRNVSGVHSWAQSMLDALNSAKQGSGGASSHGLIAALLTRLANVSPHSLALLATFAAVYAVVSAFEGYGLWRERRWAEYLTVLATAGFLPIEVHELIDRVTFVRVGAMVVNLAILVYLVRAKHLFGVGRVEQLEMLPLEPLPELVPLADQTAEPSRNNGK